MLFLMLFFSTFAFASPSPKLETPHGHKTVVQYFIYNAGMHALVVQEKQESGSFKEMQKLRMFLRPDEFLANQQGYTCQGKDKSYIYAIGSKKKVKKKKTFRPDRAWLYEEESQRIVKVQDPRSIVCK